jgi:hypothetical protein
VGKVEIEPGPRGSRIPAHPAGLHLRQIRPFKYLLALDHVIVRLNQGDRMGRFGRDADVELRSLRRRFGSVSRRYHRAVNLRQTYRRAKVPALIAIGAAGLCLGLAHLSPWPLMVTLKHIAAFPNCDAAHWVGLAPAYEGGPGYWERHDWDRDGKSCEGWSDR